MHVVIRRGDAFSNADLQRLIDVEVRESRHVEYKLEVALRSTSERTKFLHTVSSFANTEGGDLLIGIRADDGLPREIIGVPRAGIDATKLLMEQLFQSSVRPRLFTEIYEIAVSDEAVVLLIRIPRSWAAPHRVELDSKFYARNSAGKYEMDVNQLRDSFNLTANLLDRFEQIRQRRIEKILRHQIPFYLPDVPTAVLQLFPYESSDSTHRVNLAVAERYPRLLSSMGHQYGELRYNFEGIVSYYTTPTRDETARTLGFTQLHRNGVLEMVNADIRPPLFEIGDRVIDSHRLEGELIVAVRRSLALFKAIELQAPALVLFSLLRVAGQRLFWELNQVQKLRHSFEHDVLEVPGVVIDDFSQQPQVILRPILDTVWNASGWPRCMHYDDSGAFTLDPSWYPE